MARRIAGQGAAARDVVGRGVDAAHRFAVGHQPADHLPRALLDDDLRAVLGLQAVFQHLELQRPDRAEQGCAAVGRFEKLGHAFSNKLVQTGAEAFRGAGAAAADGGEALGREDRDLVELDRGIRGQRVADFKRLVAHQADHVAGEGLVDDLAFLGEQLLRIRQADLLGAGAVPDLHVALELAGDDADEGHAVPVLRVHVRLDLEDEAAEALVLGLDHRFARLAACRLRGHREEAV